MSNLTEKDFTLAAEMALGLLDDSDEANAAHRYETDALFAAEVEVWRDRLSSMYNRTSAEPPAIVWENISGQLARVDAANDNASTRLWKTLTAISTSMAAVFAALLFTQTNAQPNDGVTIAAKPATGQPTMIAALQGGPNLTAVTASYNPTNGEFLMTPVQLDTGDMYPEIWIIPADGIARSLGVMSREGASRVVIDERARRYLNQGATLAITPEKESGAPDGKPTGSILASGKITII